MKTTRNFTIDFNLDEPLPVETEIGRTGEHNAANLTVIPPAEASQNDDVLYYSLVFKLPDGSVERSKRYYRNEVGDEINIALPRSLTSCGTLRAQLEAYGEGDSLLIKTRAVNRLRFSPSLCDGGLGSLEELPTIRLGFEATEIETLNEMEAIVGATIYGDFEKYVSSRLKRNLKKVRFVNATRLSADAFKDCLNLRVVEGLENVETIGQQAFSNCQNLESVDSLGKISQIPYRAFFNCFNLKGVSFPSTVTSVDEEAFNGSSQIESFTVDEGNANYSSVGGVLFDKNKTKLIKYPPGSPVKRYAVPEGTTSVEAKGFNGCANLTDVTLPESLTNLDSRAFFFCSALKTITAPASVTSFRSYCFYDCDAMDSAFLLGAQRLDDYVFYRCDGLRTVVLGSKGRPVAEISRKAFYGCFEIDVLIIYVEDPDSPPLYGPWGLPETATIQYVLA